MPVSPRVKILEQQKQRSVMTSRNATARGKLNTVILAMLPTCFLPLARWKQDTIKRRTRPLIELGYIPAPLNPCHPDTAITVKVAS